MRNLLIIITLTISTFLIAQDFDQSIGVRGGLYNSFSYRIIKSEEKISELLVTIYPNSIRVVGLKENFQPISLKFTDQLFFYSGWGAHIGLTDDNVYDLTLNKYDVPYHKQRVYPVMGMDAIFGVEYKCFRYPFTFGIDYIPYFDLFGPNYFNCYLGDVACSIKYTF
jgi:hypothetical protein